MTGKSLPHDEKAGRHIDASSTDNANEAESDHFGNAGPGQSASEVGSPDDRAQLLAENTGLKDRLLRALAEVENIRRRAERDLENMRQYAVSKFAGDILSVADNLERATSSIPKGTGMGEGALRTLIEGVELTEKELLHALEKHGVRKLDPMGERFDPNFHEALFEVPDPSVPHGTVTKVLQSGYAIGQRVLRPAKVGVARGGLQLRSTSTPRSESGKEPG